MEDKSIGSCCADRPHLKNTMGIGLSTMASEWTYLDCAFQLMFSHDPLSVLVLTLDFGHCIKLLVHWTKHSHLYPICQSSILDCCFRCVGGLPSFVKQFLLVRGDGSDGFYTALKNRNRLILEDRYVIADSTMTDADVDRPDGRHGFIQKKRLRWWDGTPSWQLPNPGAT